MKPHTLEQIFSTCRLYVFMLVDLCLWAFRLLADLFLETIGLLHLPQRGRIPPVTDPLLLQSATVLAGRIRRGEVKCETLVRAYIERIKVVNPLVNAMVSDCFEEALADARAIDERVQAALSDRKADQSVLSLPLLGIPFSIKECISVRGQPCSAGLYSRREIRMEEDAPAVKSLRNAGAVILGVTNVPEFLLWWDTNNRLYGRTNNPYDLSRISGGSSGGEAALMSAAGSLVGMGSDIGGSIRIPSFFNGVFGHKPSSDIVPCTGNYPYCGHPEREKFLVLGPIVRYPVDLKLVMRAIVHPHLLPALRFDEPVDLRRSKFYFLTSDGDPMKTPVCPDVVEGIQRARQCLSEHGCTTLDANLPLLRDSFYMWLTALADMDSPKLAAEVMERKGELNGWLELAKSMTVGSHFRKITCLNVILENAVFSQSTRQWPVFRRVVERCRALKRQLESLLDDDAILILPTLPEKAPKHNGTFLRMNNCGYTAIFNIMELPVTQVTLGLGRRTAMPVGFQVVGRRLNDRLTIATAELLASRFDGWTPPFQVQL